MVKVGLEVRDRKFESIWPFIETKFGGFPNPSSLRNGVYLLVKSSNIVIGKP